jgi:hypothetical protein
MLSRKTARLSDSIHAGRSSWAAVGRVCSNGLAVRSRNMQSLDLRSSAWDRPEDRDHPAVLMIITLFCIAMFSLVYIYG